MRVRYYPSVPAFGAVRCSAVRCSALLRFAGPAPPRPLSVACWLLLRAPCLSCTFTECLCPGRPHPTEHQGRCPHMSVIWSGGRRPACLPACLLQRCRGRVARKFSRRCLGSDVVCRDEGAGGPTRHQVGWRGYWPSGTAALWHRSRRSVSLSARVCPGGGASATFPAGGWLDRGQAKRR